MRLGADPEVFLTNKKQLVSCVGLVKGTKEHPAHIPGMPKGFTVQQDNVALEFGIPPAASAEQFVQHIYDVQVAAGKVLPKGLSYSSESCVSFPKEELNTAEANVFGCEPDYNAWTGKENPPPKVPDRTLRSAGGHVHIETQLDPVAVVRACDLFMGLPSLIEDSKGAARRQLYGKPGAFRAKPYGVEYRVLSNYWIFSIARTTAIWQRASKALEFVHKYGVLEDQRVQAALLSNDAEAAHALMKEYKVQ